MKNGWPIKKLADVADSISTGPFGTMLHKSDYVLDGIPLVNPVNIVNSQIVPSTKMMISEETRDRLSNYKLRKGDIVVGRRGDLGRCAIVTEKEDGWLCGTGSCFIRLSEQIDERFFVMLFGSSRFRSLLEAASVGTTMSNLNHGILNNLPIPVPPLPEQRRIVGILDEAFDGIATAKANAEKNCQNARALFESHLQGVFTQRGEGWVEKSFSDICEISSALVDPRGEEFLDLPHVGGANIASKTGELIDLKTAREEGLISGKFAFDGTMTLYSKIRPYLMKVARPDFQGLCSADIYPLSVNADQLNRDYLFHLLLSPKFTEYAIAGSARAGMPKVNRDHLFAFRVYLPSVTTQKQFAAKLDGLQEETQRLESIYQRKLAALDELKKSLLHRAFCGEL